MNRKLSITLLVLLVCSVSVLSQTSEEKNSPVALALEVTSFKGFPPARQKIAASAASAKWTWYARFQRVPNYQSPVERKPVRAVKLVPYMENDLVKINVTVFTGERTFEKEEPVVAYSGKKNQQITVKELTGFGIEPFEIKIIGIEPTTSVLPLVENRAPSLQVRGVGPKLSTLPVYRIELKNNSNKAVIGFALESSLNGKTQLHAMPHEPKARPLIEVGGTLVKEIPSALDYKQPIEQQSQTITILSVFFADGSYEGEPLEAAEFNGFTLGRKQQIKQILKLIETYHLSDAEISFDDFIKKISNLETRPNEDDFAALLKKFPSLTAREKSGIRACTQVASAGVKKEFLEEMEKHRSDFESGEISRLLKIIRGEYIDWFNRLP